MVSASVLETTFISSLLRRFLLPKRYCLAMIIL
nr:MAG TPA: hypothetical protein [Caudoviricetes sp.]